MNKNRRRSFGLLALVGSATALACSVDTSSITFVDDDRFDMIVAGKVDTGTGNTGTGDTGAGGAPDTGGTSTTAGTTSKAGTTSSAGTGTGGSTTTGGKTSGGAGAGGKASGGAPPGGAAGMVGMAGSNTGVCPDVRADPTQPLIDDFNDGNPGLPMIAGRRGGWFVNNDGTGTQMPPSDPMKPPLPEKPGYDMAGYALHTSGGGFTKWGASVGFNLLDVPAMPPRPPCPYDVSVYTGVRFYLKGMVTDAVLHVDLGTMETIAVENGGTCQAPDMCFDNYSFDVTPVPPTWKQVTIPFAQLAQRGFGKKVALNLAHALAMNFTAHANTQFDLWIDQLEFY